MPDLDDEAPLLYLVAGPTRTGKSIIAQRFNRATGISTLSTDDLVRMLQTGAPELGILHDIDWRVRRKKLGPFIDGLVEVRMERGVPLLIEGEIWTEQVASLIESYGSFVRACCVGDCATTVEAKAAAMWTYSEANPYDWSRRMTDERRHEFAAVILAASLEFRAAAQRLGIPFFDMATGFEAGVEAAVKYLGEG